MTTKPKAKKFRIRRPGTSEGAGKPAVAPTEDAAPKPAPVDAAPSPIENTRPVPETAPDPAPEPSAGSAGSTGGSGAGDTDLDAIKREGLTGRQLRMARRVAQKHGIAPTSDYDAVRQLRSRGIDPFQRSTMLELVVPETPDAPPPAETESQETKIQLPQTMQMSKAQVPSTEVKAPAERRAAEIMQIQKDIARRRRKKLALLATRLAFFVLIPTFFAGYYFFAVATPMYATKSEFLILKNDGGGGGVGGLLSGTQFATNQDAIAVQSYLQSKDAMLRLDQDEGFKAHFTQDWIDPIQRLSEDPSNEEAYKVYTRNIEIGYDPTEGVIKMEVSAADPDLAAQFSAALISYAEERVDNLSARKRTNAVQDAIEGLEDAERARQMAQERLVRLQQEGAIVDPEGRIASLRGQINNVEIQLQDKRLELQALEENRRPNAAKVDAARGDIRRLNTLLVELNDQMVSASQGEGSLAELAVQIQLAQADLATRDLMLQAALERLETARRDADSQARYLTTSVEPVPSEDPSYPRKFENTVLSFLIFAGIYLMISLTASILREQVSS